MHACTFCTYIHTWRYAMHPQRHGILSQGQWSKQTSHSFYEDIQTARDRALTICQAEMRSFFGYPRLCSCALCKHVRRAQKFTRLGQNTVFALLSNRRSNRVLLDFGFATFLKIFKPEPGNPSQRPQSKGRGATIEQGQGPRQRQVWCLPLASQHNPNPAQARRRLACRGATLPKRRACPRTLHPSRESQLSLTHPTNTL